MDVDGEPSSTGWFFGFGALLSVFFDSEHSQALFLMGGFTVVGLDHAAKLWEHIRKHQTLGTGYWGFCR